MPASRSAVHWPRKATRRGRSGGARSPRAPSSHLSLTPSAAKEKLASGVQTPGTAHLLPARAHSKSANALAKSPAGTTARVGPASHYNYFRDFDPATGRYAKSDPIGLYGASWSTYAYADGNPVSSIDPQGLMGRGGCRPSQARSLQVDSVSAEVRVDAGVRDGRTTLPFRSICMCSPSGTYTQYGDVFFGTGASGSTRIPRPLE